MLPGRGRGIRNVRNKEDQVTDTVLKELESGILTVTLNRPEKKNAFNGEQYGGVRDALNDAREDTDVRVVIVTGAGDAFTAGQDLRAMGQGFEPFLAALVDFDKPLLAAVNGVAVGVGTTMLFHCDIVHVAASARLRMPFVSLGMMTEAGSSYLVQLVVGPQKAAELLFTGDWISADEAVEFGIASKRLPDDDLLPSIRAVAQKIAVQPLTTLQHNKRLLRDARKDALSAAIGREREVAKVCVGSPENREAIRAFMEKRPPDFSKLA